MYIIKLYKSMLYLIQFKKNNKKINDYYSYER